MVRRGSLCYDIFERFQKRKKEWEEEDMKKRGLLLLTLWGLCALFPVTAAAKSDFLWGDTPEERLEVLEAMERAMDEVAKKNAEEERRQAAEAAEQAAEGRIPAVETIVLTIGEKEAMIFGQRLEIEAAPMIVDGRTMLPIRFVAEALGGSADWSREEQRVTITCGENTIVCYSGRTDATVNAAAAEMEVPVLVEEGRAYLPLRFVTEALGGQVQWNAEREEVILIPAAAQEK